MRCAVFGWDFHGEPSISGSALRPDEIACVLDEVQSAAEGGLFVVGLVSYEAGEAMAGLEPRKDDFPYIWYAAFGEGRPHVPAIRLASRPRPNLTPEITRADHEKSVEKIHRYITAGDTYQVNLTFRMRGEAPPDPFALFAEISSEHPVPYPAYIETGRWTVLSLSPEVFIEKRGGKARARPMKGTAPRGDDPSRDEAAAARLGASAKDRAENLMIVDLLRNDLGKVAVPGGVSVPALFEIERYRTLLQMTSTVEARLGEGIGWADIVRAAFPSGSVTGAPKRRTMEIIRELEASPRRAYTGSIFLIEPGGDFVMSVAIRTLVIDMEREECELGVGGGIVIDSRAGDEWEEALLKSRFLLHGPSDAPLLVETMRFDGKGIPLLDYHLERIEASAVSLDFPFPKEGISSRLQTIPGIAGKECAVRLSLDREGGISIETRPIPPPMEDLRVALAPERAVSGDPYLRHKTTRRELYERWRRRAEEEGIFEYIFMNERGEVTEGTITNIFISTGGRLLTPPVESGCLPGVMRARIMEEEGALEAVITVPDLMNADEIFLTNAVRGKIRVRAVIP